ncbi:MAG: hypothetical protein RLZZ241_892 [Bacteroidota bacterium]
MLQTRNLSKSYPGVQALTAVNVTLYPGKVNAILGENGAGKSTLLKILTGVISDYDGDLLLNGAPIRFKTIREAQQAGISIIHQELNLIPNLNVSENLFLGREPVNLLGLPRTRYMHRQAQKVLKKVGLDINPETPLNQLKVGQQQLVEIARSLLSEARIILMDEPTSALNDAEIENLHRIVRELREDGCTLAYISHKMDELFRIADYFVVLRDGQQVGAGELSQTNQKELIRLMVGRDVTLNEKMHGTLSEEIVLEITDLHLAHPNLRQKWQLNGISFTLRKGEILGIFGLMGSGRTELLETLFGMYTDRSIYKMNLAGRPGKPHSPREAIGMGIALLTEDRKAQGLVLGMDIASNIGLTNLQGSTLLSRKKEAALALRYIADLRIKTPSERQLCLNLSGGNQQKVVLAKWLNTQPVILMLDEPTRGIDIRVKDEIYTLIRQLAADGMSVILVSSEIPEIRALADRILVLSEGRLSGIFPASGVTDETLLEAALPQFESNLLQP